MFVGSCYYACASIGHNGLMAVICLSVRPSVCPSVCPVPDLTREQKGVRSWNLAEGSPGHGWLMTI